MLIFIYIGFDLDSRRAIYCISIASERPDIPTVAFSQKHDFFSPAFRHGASYLPLESNTGNVEMYQTGLACILTYHLGNLNELFRLFVQRYRRVDGSGGLFCRREARGKTLEKYLTRSTTLIVGCRPRDSTHQILGLFYIAAGVSINQ